MAVQGITLLALVAVDYQRKRLRRPVEFPRVPPRSVTAGTSEVTVYTYGEDLYRDMLDAIRQAKSRIFFETFIWKGDEVGQAFKTALIDAANRGVKVYVVFDEFANLVVPRRFFRFPTNVAVRRHPLIASGFSFPRNSGRDHRKLMVVDDVAAFIGGYNIGSLYATDWRDTHARLTGDIVWDVQNSFIDYWNLFTSRRRASLPDFGSRTWQPDIRIHRNIPRNMVYPIRGMYLEAIDRASHHIYLTHAYLIPDQDMLDALVRAARRGVDVRIIIPAESNHIVADWLSPGLLQPAAARRRPAVPLPGRHGPRQDRHHRRPVVDDRHRQHRPAQPAGQLRDQHGGLQPRRRPPDGGDLLRRLHQHRRDDPGGLAAPQRHGQVLRNRPDPVPAPPLIKWRLARDR